MEYIIAGLGNPGEEYRSTRHNIGRMVAELLHDRFDASDWRYDKTSRAKISHGSVSKKDTIKIVLPDNYMNRSGSSVVKFVKNKKQAEKLIVIHDDIDIPIGSLKIVFNRGTGGHRGVESIEHSIKTSAFIRVRVGVVPLTPSGKLKKPKGKDKVYNFILKNISKKDNIEIQKVVEIAADAVEAIIFDGYLKAMSKYNLNNKK